MILAIGNLELNEIELLSDVEQSSSANENVLDRQMTFPSILIYVFHAIREYNRKRQGILYGALTFMFPKNLHAIISKVYRYYCV